MSQPYSLRVPRQNVYYHVTETEQLEGYKRQNFTVLRAQTLDENPLSQCYRTVLEEKPQCLTSLHKAPAVFSV